MLLLDSVLASWAWLISRSWKVEIYFFSCNINSFSIFIKLPPEQTSCRSFPISSNLAIYFSSCLNDNQLQECPSESLSRLEVFVAPRIASDNKLSGTKNFIWLINCWTESSDLTFELFEFNFSNSIRACSILSSIDFDARFRVFSARDTSFWNWLIMLFCPFKSRMKSWNNDINWSPISSSSWATILSSSKPIFLSAFSCISIFLRSIAIRRLA